MSIIRRLVPVSILLVFLAGFWIWWNRPERVDMTAYVPADSIIYLEANSLPEVATALTETDAWKALAPAAGLKVNSRTIDWLSRLEAWTGIGPAESVILSRAQLAVTVINIDVAASGDTLKIKPSAAIVAETHTGEARARGVLDRRVGEFARRAYGNPDVRSSEVEGVRLTTWSAPGGDRRIVAAVIESVVIIGNDEAAVKACLAVRRGERPSLAGNVQLEEMRRRVGAPPVLSFGYVSPAGAARLLEVAAPIYVSQLSSDARAQSVAASLLPQLAGRILGGAGWSARLAGGEIEDRYFIGLQQGIVARLKEPLAPPADRKSDASQFLPADTYSLTEYSYRDPAAAWEALNASVSSQLPGVTSFLFTRILSVSLKAYGIDDPASFMRAIGPEIATGRLDESGQRTAIVVGVRDEAALRGFVARRLGTNSPVAEHIGDAVLLRSSDSKRGAASFLSGYLLMGDVEDVRHCLEARSESRLLASAEPFRRAQTLVPDPGDPAGVITFTKDTGSARDFMSAVLALGAAGERRPAAVDFGSALAQLPYTVARTRPSEGGFERITHSSFGQFGALAAQLAPDVSGRR